MFSAIFSLDNGALVVLFGSYVYQELLYWIILTAGKFFLVRKYYNFFSSAFLNFSVLCRKGVVNTCWLCAE